MYKIAIIEDDKLLNDALALSLRQEGYEVLCGYTCREGVKMVAEMPDLMLLDMNLPDGSGIKICKEANLTGDIPVIFLTARDEEVDMLKAFDAGCDDYMVKPFALSVMKKRVSAVLRRSAEEKDILNYKNLTIDYVRKQVSYKQQPIALSAKEYQLLEFLSRHKTQVMTKEILLEQLWDADGMFVGENTISVTINRLRKKIEPDPAKPVFVKNVFGMGYTFGE